MTLGTVQGVIDLCKSTDTDLISRMLVKARPMLTNRLLLAQEGLATPASDTALDTAVEAIAAVLVGIGPGAVDPRTGYTVDGFSRKDGNKSQLDEWQDIADECIAGYVAAHPAATSSIPSMAIVGRRGRRIGEYNEMTTAEEDIY
ncbi:MAG: hypothetical protein U9Q37_03865 [Euryarchaeota archaeon]|nr:hypothetical protein [Euryarchaeota archaeon]